MRCDVHAGGVPFVGYLHTLPARARVPPFRLDRTTMLNMNHLPVLDRNALKPQSPDWGRAAGNIEDAKIALEGLKALVHDAVYLDEDAYTGALHASSSQSRLQVCTELALPRASCFPTWAHCSTTWDHNITRASFPSCFCFISGLPRQRVERFTTWSTRRQR